MTEQRSTPRLRRLRHFLPHPFPFLFGVATVTALVASNPEEGTVAANLVDPLIVATSVMTLAWAASSIILRDRLQRSLAAVCIAVPLLLSGYLFAWLRVMHLQFLLGAVAEVLLLAVLICTVLVLVGRTNWSSEAARFFNLFGVLTVLLTLPATLRTLEAPQLSTSADPTPLPDTVGLHRPDIFLVILDAYSGPGSLQRVYGFDNAPFIDSLRHRGFVVPAISHSNYVKTFLSLGSMLNRTYLNDLAATTAPEFRERARVYQRMEVNRTVVDLKRLGYAFYYVGSSYPPLASNRLADRQFSRRPSRQFENLWYRTTVLPAILKIGAATGLLRVSDVPFEAESASETLARVEYLHELLRNEERKFVLAHWLLPHGPYRFDRECHPRPERWTVGIDGLVDEATARGLYIDQVICTNRMILDLVDAIRDASGDEAVILLQADHGNGRFPGDEPPRLEQATPDQVRERFDVFAAYSGPRSLADSLGAQRTPINVSRTLFRVLWGVEEPPLEDRSYWSQGKQPLLLVPVELGGIGLRGWIPGPRSRASDGTATSP